MTDYESRYDPKYSYNRNAFAHKALPQALIDKTVKLIVTPIGLVSEAIHHRKEKQKKRSTSNTGIPPATVASPSNDKGSSNDGEGTAYVNLPADHADELIASGRAVSAQGEKPTHELVREDTEDGNEGMERDEADWALDEAAEEMEEMQRPTSPTDDGKHESVETLVQSIQPANSSSMKISKTSSLSSSSSSSSKSPYPVILPPTTARNQNPRLRARLRPRPSCKMPKSTKKPSCASSKLSTRQRRRLRPSTS